jgi:hypothetical protein
VAFSLVRVRAGQPGLGDLQNATTLAAIAKFVAIWGLSLQLVKNSAATVEFVTFCRWLSSRLWSSPPAAGAARAVWGAGLAEAALEVGGVHADDQQPDQR